MFTRTKTSPNDLQAIKKYALQTLVYFNLFNYPLRKREIYIFLGYTGSYEILESALQELLAESVIFKTGDFFSLSSDPAVAARRRDGNVRAMRLLQMAGRHAGFLSRFPYVRGVAVSGSLSKNFADKDADIDFFIITAKNRLWIARTCLHLFKKFTFLLRMQHYFCMNYFVDEGEPVIREKNIYTATEVTTLLPLRGPETFQRFFLANDWTKNFLPNNYMRVSSVKPNKDNLIKTILETVMRGPFGNWLDNLFMKMTIKSWGSKTAKQQKNNHGNILALDAGKHYAKPCPKNFQHKLLGYYDSALKDILLKVEDEPAELNTAVHQIIIQTTPGLEKDYSF